MITEALMAPESEVGCFLCNSLLPSKGATMALEFEVECSLCSGRGTIPTQLYVKVMQALRKTGV